MEYLDHAVSKGKASNGDQLSTYLFVIITRNKTKKNSIDTAQYNPYSQVNFANTSSVKERVRAWCGYQLLHCAP